MKILIVGCNGQLGRDCQTAFGARHELMCLDLPEIDIVNPDSIRTAMQQFAPKPSSTAPPTRGDDAEKHPEPATGSTRSAINTWRRPARPSRRLFHISTDYVLDGLAPAGRGLYRGRYAPAGSLWCDHW